MTPHISVVMNVRNGGMLLTDALRSLTSQTFSDFELIVVNDGSTDETAEVLEAWRRQDNRILVYHHDPAGIVSAANFGCSRARAKYVARMDADDVSLPDRFERQLEFLVRNPEVTLVGGAAAVVDPRGLRIGGMAPPCDSATIASCLREANCFINSTVMFARNAFERCGGYRAAFEPSEDYDFFLRMSERYPLANLGEDLVHYRVHSGQVSGRRVEQQAITAAGAREAARLRQRAGSDALIMPDSPLTAGTLLELGVARRVIADSVFGSYALQANRLSRAGAENTAQILLRDALQSPHLAQCKDNKARLHWQLAKSYRRGGDHIRAAAEASAALVSGPQVALAKLLRPFRIWPLVAKTRMIRKGSNLPVSASENH
jgi:glycosyltransferase involved in cell wall biosynthesis